MDFSDLLVVYHCSNHRLEFSVGDTVDEGSNNFKSFIDKLYSLYHASPKNQRELKDYCSVLDTHGFASFLQVELTLSSLEEFFLTGSQLLPALSKGPASDRAYSSFTP